jgi:predicted transcriptional regulator
MDYTKVKTVYKKLSFLDLGDVEQIVNLLTKDGEMTCESIVARLKFRYDRTNTILKGLLSIKVVKKEKEGKYAYYSINPEQIMKINNATALLSKTADKLMLI